VGQLLTRIGVAITAAALMFGTWLQVVVPATIVVGRTSYRLTLALESLVPFAIGFVVIAAGQILSALESHRETPHPPGAVA